MRLSLAWLLAIPLVLAAVPSAPQQAPEPEPDSPKALLQSAAAQIELGEFAAAQAGILETIDRIEVADDPDTGLLIDALTSLASAYVADGVHWRALAAYEEAASLSRREYGLFNETLIAILEQMRQTAAAAGDLASASEYREEGRRISRLAREQSVRISGQTHGTDSLEYLNARLELAGWLAAERDRSRRSDRSGWRRDARAIYADALDMVDKEFNNDPALNVRVLRLMARDVGDPLGQLGGEGIMSEPIELVRAERIARRMTEPDPVLHAAVLLDTAYWRLRENLFRLASKSFGQAWKLLEGVDDERVAGLISFAEPEIVESATPRSLQNVLSSATDARRGKVELEFFVDERGRPHDIRVVSAEPSWASEAAVNLVARSLIRPSVDDGRFVAAPGRYIWSFGYDPDMAAALGLSGRRAD